MLVGVLDRSAEVLLVGVTDAGEAEAQAVVLALEKLLDLSLEAVLPLGVQVDVFREAPERPENASAALCRP